MAYKKEIWKKNFLGGFIYFSWKYILRVNGFLPSRDDVYVPVKFVRQYGLRKGDHLLGAFRPANRSEKNPALLQLDAINGIQVDGALNRPDFADLTPVYPNTKLKLERG